MPHAHRAAATAFALVVLIATTAHAAITVADNAYTEHDYRKALLAFNRRTLVEAYEKWGRKDPKWDEPAKAFLEGWAIRMSNGGAEAMYRLPGEPPYAKLRELEEATINAGCDDPFVRYCRVIRMQEDGRPPGEVMAILEEITPQLVEIGARAAGEPSWRAVWAQHRICQFTDPRDAAARANAWDQFKEVAIDFIVRAKCEGTDARFIYFYIWDTLEREGPDYQQAFVKALKNKPGGDDWLRQMIFGSADIEAAWHFRGGGWANTVTDGGWAGFRRHLTQAREHLTAAWKLNPKFPEAAAEMITVAMGAGDKLGEQMRPWLDKAVSAQFDYAPAYNNYLWSIRPRWHGTIGQMYDFGVECAQTKRYDTRVPRVLLQALDDIASDMGGTQFWRQPGVYEQVKELYDGMTAAAAKRESPGEVDNLRSEQAAFAWRVGRYEEARQVLDELGERFNRNAFERFNAMGMLAASHAYAMRPGLSETITEAERQASMNQLDDATKTYQAALEKLDAKDKATFYFKSRIRQLQWQKQFEAGEWVDIQPTKDFAGWSPQYGQWEVDEQGGVVGTYEAPRQWIWLPCQGQFTGRSFVIEGNAELLGDGNAQAGVGMTYNSLSRIYGLFLQRARRDGKTTLRRDFWPGAQDEIELQPTNKFTFTFAAGRVSASVNDKEVFKDYDIGYMWKSNRSYLGVGGRWGERGGKIRFTNLRIRAGNAPAAAPEPGAEAQEQPAPQPVE